MSVTGDYPDPLAWQLDPAGVPPDDHEADEPWPLPTSWQPHSLADYRDTTPPAASLMPVAGPAGLLYPGCTHAVYGEPGSGKSWLLVAAIVAVLRMHPASWVLLIDLEDGPRIWAARFRQVGVPGEELRRIAYLAPREPINGWGMLPLLVQRLPMLVCLDGLTGFYRLHGQDPDSGIDTDRVMGALDEGIASTGAAVLIADHVTKGREGRRFAVGSGHKLARLTGSGYRVEPADPLPIRRGHLGRSRVVLTKDRPGGIPCRVEHEAARLVLDDRQTPARVFCEPGEDWG